MASMASDKLLIMIGLIISQAKFEGGGGGGGTVVAQSNELRMQWNLSKPQARKLQGKLVDQFSGWTSICVKI